MKLSSIVQDVTIRARAEGVEAAAQATEQLARAGDAVTVTADKVQRATLDVSRAYERLQRDIDVTFRQQQAFERGMGTLDRALSQNKISTEAYDRSVSLLTQKYGPAAQAADRFGASVKTSTGQVGGIAAQFQDVAVQLAGGQSPFLIALQQGTQLSAQLEQTGGGVRALGAAFLSLVSPMSLATIGGIAAFGLLVQYISSAAGQAETLDQRLEKHADVIRKIKDAYGELAEGVDKYASESSRVLELQLRGVTEKLKAGVQQAAREIGALTTISIVSSDTQFGIPSDLVKMTFEATGKFAAFKDAVVTLRQELDTGTVNLGRFRDEVARVANATSDANVQKLAAELLAMSDAAFKAEQALGGSARAIGVLSAAASSGLVALNGYNAALRSLQMGVPELAKVVTAQKDLGEAREQLNKGLADAKTAESAGGMTERAAAAATETYARRVGELNDAYQQRVRTITGASSLEKELADTLKSKTIAALEGEAQGIARARQEYEKANERIEESVKLGMSEAEATKLRALNQKNLAQELKNVAAANRDKGGSGGGGGGADAYDNAIQRLRDQTEELRLQQEQASKTGAELYKLEATNRLRRAAASAGRSDEEGLAAAIEATAEAYARQRKATEDAIEAQRRYQEGIRATAEMVTSFVEDLIGGKGLDGALKSLGRTYLSNSLDALISGKGSLAGLTGLAASEKGGQGGLLGLLTGGLKPLTDAVAKGTAKGSAEGFETGFHRASASNDNFNLLGGLNIDGKQLAGGLNAIAGLAGAYGIGLSAGSVGQAVGGGAISGLTAGLGAASAGLGSAAVLGPIGIIAGAALGYFGNQSAKKAAKEQRRQEAQANYDNAKGDIASFRSQARGEPQDTLAKRIAEAEASARKLADIAFFAGKLDEAAAVWADSQVYRARAIREYQDGFDGLIDSLNSGLGPNSPFATAKSTIKDFGDQLKAFIDNAKTAYGEGAPQVEQARQAAANYALAVLDGAQSLSTVQTRMLEIEGTSAGLEKVLTDLGWAADAAGKAVSERTTAALARLKTTFETDLERKTNDARDKSYLNDARDLIDEVNGLYRDAGALGTDPAAVGRYFTAAAQAIVDGANLTGEAFLDFTAKFPDLAGGVVEAGKAIDSVSRQAEIAARRLQYQDRLFNATNDSSTLEGQLAAFDRTAIRERQDEIKAGGEALVELETAQMAERLKIVRDFNEQANESYRQSLEQAKDYVTRFARSIREYLDGLRAGSNSPLSPADRLAAAQSQYNAQLALAQGGNRDALDGITGYASDLEAAARAFYASSSGYQAIFQQIQDQLGALPSQISPEQFIVNAITAGTTATTGAIDAMKLTLQAAVANGSASAIATALSTYFNRIDANTSGSIDFAEMQAALGGMASNSQLRDMFTRLDVDNTGALTQLGLIKAATDSGTTAAQGTKASVEAQQSLLNAIRSFTDLTNQNVAYGNTLGTTLNSLSGDIKSSTASSAGSLFSLQAMVEHTQAMRLMMRLQNQYWGAGADGRTQLQFYREGGLIGGVGTGTSDSNMIMASRGEFIMRAAAVDRFGAGMLAEMNDNLRMPVMPVPVAAAGQPNAALVAKVEALTAEIKQMRAENNQGHSRTASAAASGAMHVREGVDEVAENTAAAARAERRLAAKAA